MTVPNRTALVTGGARRIGAAIVRELHASGLNVLIHCHRARAAADALAAELEAIRPGSTAVVSCDLLADASAPDLVARAVTRFGGLDVLVNNASTFYPSPVGEVTSAHWDDLVGTNLRAPFFLSQAAAPALRVRKGCIVNIVDVHANRPVKGHAVYCSAKAGLAMLTMSLARELGPDIRVNGVAPGAIVWPEGGMDAAVQRQIIEATALKRQGEPRDIATMVRFLALEAGYVTGQIIAVDGGRSLGWS